MVLQLGFYIKWWIIGSDIPLLSTEEGTTLDLSHSFTHIEIKGASSKIFFPFSFKNTCLTLVS